MAFETSASVGAFIPTTFVYDISQIYAIDVNTPEFKEFLVVLYQNMNKMAQSINIRDAGYYDTNEFVNGQMYFPNPALTTYNLGGGYASYRQVYRKVFNFGALPNIATKSVAHTIPLNPKTTFTRIYGAASDTTGRNYIPLPYASPTLANSIELNVDATSINVTTGSNRTNFNTSYIVLEYIQQ
jgi:hypothetical protein